MDTHRALIALYKSLKSRAEIQSEEERSLLDIEPLALVNYISSYIDIAVNVQVEKALKGAKENDASESLEQLTQSLEAEIREHIRVCLFASYF